MKCSSGVWSGAWSGVWKRGNTVRGGVFPIMVGVCFPHPFPMLLYFRLLSAIARPDRAAPDVRGRTGATPPFLPLVRHAGRGGVSGGVSIGVSPHPPPLGVAPVRFIPAGRLRTRTTRGR